MPNTAPRRDAAASLAVASAVLAGSLFALSVERNPVPPPLEPEFRAFLAHFDSRYDPRERMVRVEFRNPGYHSRVPSGAVVHPTRESLAYAVALLQRGREEDVARAVDVLRRVVRLQDADPDSPTYGVWPWLLEEPLAEMSTPDPNWADFCGAHLAAVLHDHGDRLPKALRAEVRSALRRAAESIRRRDVGPGYTNIAVLGGAVCAAAGELLRDASLLAYGRRRLQHVVAHTAEHGGFAEYNSPPYAQVVITACERALHLVEDRATRAAAESLRRTTWRAIADHFHAGTNQWAGPHSRTSRDRLRSNTCAFLSQRTGVEIPPHPTMAEGPPRGFEVVPPLPCPSQLVRNFRVPPAEPFTFRRTFVRRPPPSRSLVGTTWTSPDACLGSVSRSSFWTQRKPLVGYWRTEADPAVVFRVRFLKDGRDFASTGLRTEQAGPRVLLVLQSLTGRGDWHRTLDRPEDGRFTARDLRLRCELRGNGTRATELGNGAFALAAGDHQVVVHTAPGRFAGRDVRWELGRDGDRVFLDGICHEGGDRAFDFDEPLEVVVGCGIELAAAGGTTGAHAPLIGAKRGHLVEATWRIAENERLTLRARQSK